MQILSNSMRKQIYDYLREQMNAGKLRPGKMINQRELSEQLGVSRTPLRDTMIQLEAEGLVKIVPCRGIFIKRLSLSDVCDYFQIAGALEGMAFELALPHITEDDIQGLEKNINETLGKISEMDFSTCNAQNDLFHGVVLGKCQNKKLVENLSGIRDRLYNFPYTDPTPAAEWERVVWREHEEMLNLIKRKEKEKLGTYVAHVHWRPNEAYIKARFDLGDAEE